MASFVFYLHFPACFRLTLSRFPLGAFERESWTELLCFVAQPIGSYFGLLGFSDSASAFSDSALCVLRMRWGSFLTLSSRYPIGAVCVIVEVFLAQPVPAPVNRG